MIFDGIYKIKNYPAPTKMELTVEAGIDATYTNQKELTLSIAPFDYLPNGSKSTGFIDIDIENYACDILDTIREKCFFDFNKPREAELGNKYIDFLSNKPYIDKKVINNFKSSFRKSFDFYYLFKLNKDFMIRINNVNDDIKLPFNINNIHKFLLLFDSSKFIRCTELKGNRVFLDSYIYMTNFDLVHFLDLLYRVFIFFYSQTNRDIIISSAIKYSNYAFKRYDCTYHWDINLKKFFTTIPLEFSTTQCSHLNSTSNNIFRLDLISEQKGNHTEKAEVTDIIDRKIADYCEKNNSNIYITKEAERNRTFSISKEHEVFSYIGYLPYIDNNNKKVALSFRLYGKLKDTDLSKCINLLFLSHKPFREFSHKKKATGIKSIKYEDIFIDIPVKELFNKDLIEFESDVCYYTSRKTEISYDDLVNKSFPKQRRDYLYRIFCNICCELGLNPLKVKEKMNINFLKSYKDIDLIGG